MLFFFAVLEHLRDPLIGLVEVARVLQAGGFYLGTVSLEAFHASFFHPPLGPFSIVAAGS